MNLEENINHKVDEEIEISPNENQFEIDSDSNDLTNSITDIENLNQASARRLSLFDTLSEENKSEDISVKNDILGKTEPVLETLDKKPEVNKFQDNIEDVNENEEFSAEEIENSEIDNDFNQENEEELLDIPTFLRRQAN